MSEQEIEQHVLDLMKGISGVSYDTLMMAFGETDAYTVWSKKKKSGKGFRTIAEPPENLKTFQRGLLATLKRLDKRSTYYRNNADYIPQYASRADMSKNISYAMHGGLKSRSTRTLIQSHTWTNAHFVIKIDLKQAFPHATSAMVQTLFQSLLEEEISFLFKAMSARKKFLKHTPVQDEHQTKESYYYECLKLEDAIKSQYPRYTLLPTTRVPRFRALLRSLHAQGVEYHNSNLVEIISRVSLYLTNLVTRDDSIPQGAPTSNMILNILLARTGLFSFVGDLFENGVGTVYTDDIIISTMSRPTIDQINTLVEKMEAIGFPYNSEKLSIYDLRHTSAHVLGMKLVKRPTSRKEVILKSGSPGYKYARGSVKADRISRPWYATHATLSKSTQKKYRACFHKACRTIGWSQEFFDTLLGYHGHIVSTYGWPTPFMPASLKSIVQEFRDKFKVKGGSPFPKESSYKRNYATKTVTRRDRMKMYRKQFLLDNNIFNVSDDDLPF